MRISVGFFLGAVLVAGQAWAACGGAPGVSVRVQTLPVSVNIDHSMGTGEITEIASRTIGTYGGDWSTNGLAGATLNFDADMTALSQKRWSTTCLSGAEVDLKFGYARPIELKISNKYEAGTCQYGVLYDHEMQHVAIYKAAISDNAAGIRAALESELGARIPMVVADETQAREALRVMVTSSMRRAMDDVMVQVRARNASIDNPENYARLQALCPGW